MSIIGSIIGDIAGSQYEFRRPKDFDPLTAELFTDRCRFTDDTVLTLAAKKAILEKRPFAEVFKEYGNRYIDVGYGGRFLLWLSEDNPQPYNSYGNGSAMRVSYIADHFNRYEDIAKWAVASAECTHNHPEGIKGARVTAVCIWMAKNNFSKHQILEYVNRMYPKNEYPFSSEYSLDEIREKYIWNETCRGCVPVAMRCALDANDYVGFIRNVFSLPCDTDTICAIGGSVAEELFDGTGLDNDAILERYLDEDLLSIVYENNKEDTDYGC